MCNTIAQNGVLKNGKILCDNCSNKLNILNGSNSNSGVQNNSNNSNNFKPNNNYQKCPKCLQYALSVNTTGFGCVTGKGQWTTVENCHSCKYYNSETEYSD